MVEKRLRIRKKDDFERVFRGGKALFFDDFACKVLRTEEKGFRIGFSFGKKHIPLATARNRARRLLKEALLQRKNEWPQGFDVIFFTAKAPKELNYATMERIAEKLIGTLNGLKRTK